MQNLCARVATAITFSPFNMKETEKYLALFQAYLDEQSWQKPPQTLYQPVDYILGLGGKRTRPLLTLLAAELFGAHPKEALPSATAIEYFHNFSLIHDDVMDEAPLRRGKPTVHHKWNINTAILSGDVLLVHAYEQLIKHAPNQVPGLLALFNRTAMEVCEGQQMDMDFEEKVSVSIADYIEMIRLKTSVLLGCALQMGAIVAGADEVSQQHLYQFGQNLGIAFQIQDDLLDAFGDPSKFGKQVGGDILAGKKTLLYLLTIDACDSNEKAAFLAAMNAESNQKVHNILDWYSRKEVAEKAKNLQRIYHQAALSELSNISVSNIQKLALEQLADSLMHREN